MSSELEQNSFAVSLDYISASANRYARTAHSSNSSLIAFGSGNFVVLWFTGGDLDKGVQRTLPGHEGLVTCVQFNDEGNTFFSADERGSVRCWKACTETGEWITAYIQQAHKKSITSLSVFRDILVTGSSDAQIAVWRISETPSGKIELGETQRLDMNGRYPLDIQMAFFPGSKSILMAIASTERNVSLYVRSEEKFIRAASLSGHEDWVKSLAFQEGVAGPSILTLASASQDGTIRLWNVEKISRDDKLQPTDTEGLSDDLLDKFEASLGETADGEEGGRQISLKRHILSVKDDSASSTQYSVTFDALLIGHEAGVTSITWRPATPKLSLPAQPMLMSTSTDSSVILWAPSSLTGSSSGESASLWINQQRFGDIGGQRLGGFVGGLWSHGGNDAFAWGWGGGWRRWRSGRASENISGSELWNEVPAISGHNGAVRGISWAPQGEYLISTGPDQTTRIHANMNKEKDDQERWHEICRPQVHGYDLVDAAFLSATRFVSIADEKVARVFDAPKSFVTSCKSMGILTDVEEGERPLAASVPPLGLSNKALSGPDPTEAHFPIPTASMSDRRPFEGELSISTLWPEIEKVFGHGYELHAIAAAHSGSLVATSCRATSSEHAGIKVYDTNTWHPFGQTLLGHQLTVTRIAFSPDDRYLLSVSRDRSWIVYERNEGGFEPIASDKSHTRIIWDCAWSIEGDLFATASRDKTVKLWEGRKLREPKQLPITTIKTKEAATAVAISHTVPSGRRYLAIGLETGGIAIYSNEHTNPKVWRQEITMNNNVAHTGQVHRLAWRPRVVDGTYQLASSSEDGTLRILRISLNKD